MSKFITRTGSGGSAGETGIINAASEVLTVDVADLINASLIVTQDTDGGTVTLNVEVSPDGTQWAPFGSALTEASFAAANGASAAPIPLQGATNGMPLVFKQARIRASAYTATGVYSMRVCGLKRDNAN